MEFSLAYTITSEKILLKHFNLETQKIDSSIMSFDDAKNNGIQGLVYNPDLGPEDFLNVIESELKFYPIRSMMDLKIDQTAFESLDLEKGKMLYERMRENWVLQNNIILIEDMFKTKAHLMSLFPNDRASFFEEFWFLLKNNLGATNLKIIYNDIIKAQNEGEKNKLVKVKVVGSRFPETTSVDEFDETILKSYEKDFGQIFDITDYNREKGQIVICASLKKSPVFIMANILTLSRIQKAVLLGLFEGLNHA